MNRLKVGFAAVNANPPLGIPVAGYYVPRFAQGFLNDIMVNALVLECGDKKIALISVDNCSIKAELSKPWMEEIEAVTGIPKDNIFLSATHTHTGPQIHATGNKEEDKLICAYASFLGQRIVNAAQLALADTKPAKMGYIYGWAPERVAYIRRYMMKDGTTMTCPPIDDPNIDHALGTLDQRVNVLRFDREGGETIVLVNYGLHADTTNGDMISADWPSWMAKTLDKALDGVKTIFFNGAEGDVGSTNVHPSSGDMNDTEISFDNEMKSPGMARFVGRAIAGSVLQVYDKVCYVDVDSIDIMKKTVVVPSNMPKPEELPLAKQYWQWHLEGRDDLIPYEAMELTTVVTEAMRMVMHEHGPETYDVNLTAVKIGPVAMLGMPGEPFTDIGVEIKKAEGWDLVLPVCLTNGSIRYFPMQSAFDEGGYEARSCFFKAGVAERIIDGALELLSEIR